MAKAIPAPEGTTCSACDADLSGRSKAKIAAHMWAFHPELSLCPTCHGRGGECWRCGGGGMIGKGSRAKKPAAWRKRPVTMGGAMPGFVNLGARTFVHWSQIVRMNPNHKRDRSIAEGTQPSRGMVARSWVALKNGDRIPALCKVETVMRRCAMAREAERETYG